jgi:hypothetical protein
MLLSVFGISLRNGDTKSCGCLRRELAQNARREKYARQWGEVYGDRDP